MEKIFDDTLRKFSYITGIGIPLIIGWLLPKLTGHEFRSWTLFIGLPILIIGFFAPNKLLYPYKVWMKIGHILGWINSKIIKANFINRCCYPIYCKEGSIGFTAIHISNNYPVITISKS